MLKGKAVAVYPYIPNETLYIGMMLGFIQSQYKLIDYIDVKNGIFDINDISLIYLNWIEDSLNEDDCFLLGKAKDNGVKIFWVFHNRIGHDCINENEAVKKVGFLVNIASKVILHSNKSRDILKDVCPDLEESKLYYIPHPNYIGDYFKFGDIRKKYAISHNDFVFFSTGSIRKYKNLETIIGAFKKIPRLDCKLLIAGNSNDAQYIQSIQKLIGNDHRIILDVRYLSSLEMESYLNASDILVLPYSLESSMNSGVMLMAFSYKKTVIVSDIAMAEDFDESLFYKYQYKNEEDHIEKLYEKMLQAICDGREELYKKGEKLFEYICDNCSKEFVQKELLNLIDKEVEHNENKGTDSFEKIYNLKESLAAANLRADIALNLLQFHRNNMRYGYFMEQNGFETVAIYGYGKIGKCLKNELADEGIKVSYVIDQRADRIEDIKAYTLGDKLPYVDLVIVTTVMSNYIKERLRQKGKKHIVLLNDLLVLRRE